MTYVFAFRYKMTYFRMTVCVHACAVFVLPCSTYVVGGTNDLTSVAQRTTLLCTVLSMYFITFNGLLHAIYSHL